MAIRIHGIFALASQIKVFMFGICNPQWRFLCGISTLRSPSKAKSVAISAGMVWSMVMWLSLCAV